MGIELATFRLVEQWLGPTAPSRTPLQPSAEYNNVFFNSNPSHIPSRKGASRHAILILCPAATGSLEVYPSDSVRINRFYNTRTASPT